MESLMMATAAPAATLRVRGYPAVVQVTRMGTRERPRLAAAVEAGAAMLPVKVMTVPEEVLEVAMAAAVVVEVLGPTAGSTVGQEDLEATQG
jgi:hypothetical protein